MAFKIRYTCRICGRCKFNKKQPHKCVGGYRKRFAKSKIQPVWKVELTGTFSDWLTQFKTLN